nr:unnamed protein product [Spirometra erinaceieuropaei]
MTILAYVVYASGCHSGRDEELCPFRGKNEVLKNLEWLFLLDETEDVRIQAGEQDCQGHLGGIHIRNESFCELDSSNGSNYVCELHIEFARVRLNCQVG